MAQPQQSWHMWDHFHFGSDSYHALHKKFQHIPGRQIVKTVERRRGSWFWSPKLGQLVLWRVWPAHAFLALHENLHSSQGGRHMATHIWKINRGHLRVQHRLVEFGMVNIGVHRFAPEWFLSNFNDPKNRRLEVPPKMPWSLGKSVSFGFSREKDGGFAAWLRDFKVTFHFP